MVGLLIVARAITGELTQAIAWSILIVVLIVALPRIIYRDRR